MKKAVMAAAGIVLAVTVLAGCKEKAAEETNSDQIEVQEETDADKENDKDVETDIDTDADLIEEEVTDKAIREAKKLAMEQLLEEEKQMIDTAMPVRGGLHIAVVSKSVEGEFWKLVKQGMEDGINAVNEAFGFEKEELITMNFEGAESELDVETQVNTIDAVIAENPDVLCISAGDMDSCMAQLEAARENGIPVVAFDSNVSESDMIMAYRATDNLEVGRMAADKLAETLHETGAVAVFSAPEMTESGKNRMEGFEQALEQYPGMEIVEIIYQDQVEEMKSAMQSAIVEHPELKGVFCSNANVSEMYLSLGEMLEDRELQMVGVDATTMQLEAVRNGTQLGVISQNPHMMGFETIWTAILTVIQDEPGVEFLKNKLLQPMWIDSTNINHVESGQYLY